jgi:hypothetical protein
MPVIAGAKIETSLILTFRLFPDVNHNFPALSELMGVSRQINMNLSPLPVVARHLPSFGASLERRFSCGFAPRAVVAHGVFLFSSLSPSRHFLKSASPRKKTDGSGRFRFRAREQTAASRAIFATLFAFQVGAADPLVVWPAP